MSITIYHQNLHQELEYSTFKLLYHDLSDIFNSQELKDYEPVGHVLHMSKSQLIMKPQSGHSFSTTSELPIQIKSDH